MFKRLFFLALLPFFFQVNAIASDFYFSNIKKQFQKRPRTGAKICYKRIEFESKKIRDKKSLVLTKKMNPERLSFLEELVSLCVNDKNLQIQIKQKEKEKIKKSLLFLINRIIQVNAKGLDNILSLSMSYVFRGENSDHFLKYSRVITKTFQQISGSGKDSSTIVKSYLLLYLEKLISYGAFSDVEKLITYFSRYKDLKLDLSLILARISTMTGNYDRAEKIYGSVGKIELNLTMTTRVIYYLEKSICLRESRKIDASSRLVEAAGAMLSNRPIGPLMGWYYLEKAHIEFEKTAEYSESVERLMSLSEEKYKQYRENGLLFLHLKKSEFYRRVRNKKAAIAEMGKAKRYVKYFSNEPYSLFYLYYEEMIQNFLFSDINSLNNTFLEYKKSVQFTGEQENYSRLVEPLILAKKGESNLALKKAASLDRIFNKKWRYLEVRDIIK